MLRISHDIVIFALNYYLVCLRCVTKLGDIDAYNVTRECVEIITLLTALACKSVNGSINITQLHYISLNKHMEFCRIFFSTRRFLYLIIQDCNLMKCAYVSYVCNNILDEWVLWFIRYVTVISRVCRSRYSDLIYYFIVSLSCDLLWMTSQTSSSSHFIDPGDLATPTLMEPFVMEISTPTI